MKVGILLANGFEETEALFVVDLLRRCNIDIYTISINKDNAVTSSHDIKVISDMLLEEVNSDEFSMLIIPGGKGVYNLKNDERVIDLIKKFKKEDKKLAAICAGPIVLNEAGVIDGKNVTSYPADEYRNLFTNSNYFDDIYVRDGNILTSAGPSTTIIFAFEILKMLGVDTTDLKKQILYDKLVDYIKNNE